MSYKNIKLSPCKINCEPRIGRGKQLSYLARLGLISNKGKLTLETYNKLSPSRATRYHTWVIAG